MTRVYEDVRGMLDINSSDLLNSHLIMLDFLTAVCVNKNTPQRPWTHLKMGELLNFLGKLSSDITLQLEAPTNDITALIWSHVSLHSTILSYDPRRLCVSADCSTSLREKKKSRSFCSEISRQKNFVYFIRFSLVFLPHVSTQKYTQVISLSAATTVVIKLSQKAVDSTRCCSLCCCRSVFLYNNLSFI